MKKKIFIILIFIFLIKFVKCSFCGSGGWVAFEDEKYFKFVNRGVTREEAEQICNNQEKGSRTLNFLSTLVSIKSPEEQQFLETYLFQTSGALNGVWISAIRKLENTNDFEWSDGSELKYNYWTEGNPTNDTNRKCVQMQSKYNFKNLTNLIRSSNEGKWLDVPCEKTNLVLCEKLQIWSLTQMQKAFLDTRKELKDSLENVTKELDITKNQLEDTRNKLSDTQNKLSDTQNKVGASAPAGAIAFFARNIEPTGWLKANGAAVSRTTYADLFTAIGITFGSGDGSNTFRLPDLRGEFVRGWSDGREVDKGRAFGSYQWGSNIPMAGHVGENPYRAIGDGFQDRWVFAGNTFDDGFEGNVLAGQTRSGTTFPDSNGYSSNVAYVDYIREGHITSWNVLKGTRPRNVALLACIKY